MERIRHIKETAQQNTGPREAPAQREKIIQEDEYNPVSETRQEQISVREFLDSIEEDVLKEIFAEYFRKAGSEESTMNWIPLDKVRIMYRSPEEEEASESPYGRYTAKKGVQLFSQNLWDDKELLLWILIHEQCHAISQDVQRRDEDHDDDFVKSGVMAVAIEGDADDDTPNEYLRDINEGITELLTERIYKEYKHRTGTNEYFFDYLDESKTVSDTEVTAATEKFAVYQRNWQAARLYIGIISAISDVPADKVEKGVIRCYLRNGSIVAFRDEAAMTLNEIHPDLEKRLYFMLENLSNDNNTLQAYIDFFDRLDISEDIKDRFYAALQEVKNEWGDAYKLADNQL